ncbi:phosphatase PAP2 family protein [Streptomyces sp. CoH27]|uniref:phosphatase PAP2 family protein n=1 Tax=Streptomyces sp. CoH27 TaxID=2875763 RepID=UPI0021E5E0E5
MRHTPSGPEKLGAVSTVVRRAPLLVLPAVLLALLTWQVVTHGPLLRLDARVSGALVHPGGRFSEILSCLGNVQVAVPVLLFAIVYVLGRGHDAGTERWWLPPLAAAVLMALVPAIVIPLKDWTARPGTPVMPPAVGYFPSGHTATAAVAYGSATLLLLPWLGSAAARRRLVACCTALVLGVSYGLVRHGYHWPLDVVASWCLSTVLLTALSLVPGAGRSTSLSTSAIPGCGCRERGDTGYGRQREEDLGRPARPRH